MSLSKAASKSKSKRAAPKAKAVAADPVVSKPGAADGAAITAHAIALAGRIEAAIAEGKAAEVVEPEAIQALMTAVCRAYSAHIEAGNQVSAFSSRNPLTPTDVMVSASGLLKAANLAVFELGMWQSWTGR